MLIINTMREAYGTDKLKEKTMTVAELIECLQEFDGEMPVILSFDNDYTYGSINAVNFEMREEGGES